MGIIIGLLLGVLIVRYYLKRKADRAAFFKQKENSWDFYFSSIDGQKASSFVNLGIHKEAPLAGYEQLACVSVKMNNPQEDGLSSQAEFSLLSKMEETLINAITFNTESQYVGRITLAGKRDFYFYLKDTTELQNIVNAAMQKHPDYHFDIHCKEEKTWDTYFSLLYPTPVQMREIENRQVIEQLKNAGDPLSKERPVFHFIYFNTDADREKFISRVAAEGFTVNTKEFDDTLTEQAYSLHIERVDKVDWESVNEYVAYLSAIAQDCHGTYDGWETSVEK